MTKPVYVSVFFLPLSLQFCLSIYPLLLGVNVQMSEITNLWELLLSVTLL